MGFMYGIRRWTVAAAVFSAGLLLAGLLSAGIFGGLGLWATGSASAEPVQSNRATPVFEEVLGLFELTGTAEQLAALPVAVEPIESLHAEGDQVTIQAILPPLVVPAVEAAGVEVVEVDRSSAELSRRQASVWKPFDGPGGIRELIESTAVAHPSLTKLVTLGQSVQERPVYALKVTADANTTPDGSRPATGYVTALHAREWITVETNLRMLNHVLDSYGSDPEITALLNSTELWFVLVGNPDGYEHTFTTDRLWRKNMRDNDENGVIGSADGVDLNRNSPHKWAYDTSGSSGGRSSPVYRGRSAASEPEMQALDAMMQMAGFEFFFDIHSAASLLLYGNGWQAVTSSPDDYIGRALVGDDLNPAVSGYEPGLGAELYLVNGDTANHAHATYGAFGITVELDTCAEAEAFLADDAIGPGYCADNGRTVFEFPDDEQLIELVFQKNLPLLLAGAQSAADPENPVSVSGYSTPEIVIQPFGEAHGASQEVAAEVKRSLGAVTLHWEVDGQTVTSAAVEWEGGERYGDEFDAFYREVRGEVTNVTIGDVVTAWFTAGGLTSDSFTYTVTNPGGADVLVIADENYGEQDPVVTAPQYVGAYTDTLTTIGMTSTVWDATAQGVPDHRAVLAHYDHVVWEHGDDRPAGDGLVSLSLRDYLNEGGKLMTGGRWLHVSNQSDFRKFYLGVRSGTGGGDEEATEIQTLGPLGDLTVDFIAGAQSGPLTPEEDHAGRPTSYPSHAGEPIAEGFTTGRNFEGIVPFGVATEDTVAFGFGFDIIAKPADAVRLMHASMELLGADLNPIPTSADVRHVVTCLAGNGRVDTNIVNSDAVAHDYRLEFEGLTPRQISVAPRDWGRMPITGRPDRLYTVTMKRDGQVISTTQVRVACDGESPLTTGPAVSLQIGCRASGALVLAQFVNDSAENVGYVMEWENLPNRSTSAAPWGATVRGVSGRPDGQYQMRVRVGPNYIYDEQVTVDCNP